MTGATSVSCVIFDRQTLVRLALSESLQPGRRKRGRPRLTWMMLIEKDLEVGGSKLT